MSVGRARELVAKARSIAVLTGAGVSAESGVPTFRGAGGLWREHRAEDLATPEAFERDPRLVWEWYDGRRGLAAQARPNPAHEALAALERRAADFCLVTQNVDGLHAAAGSRKLLEIHGCLWRTRCLSCSEVREDRRCPLPELPPRCPCGGILRPDIVWFGEALPVDALRCAVQAAETCDLMLIVGTSGLVQPAASLGQAALRRGVPVVEVNLDETPQSADYTLSLLGKAGELLPRLV